MIPLATLLTEAKRELAMRERVYPRWIERGTLSQTTAMNRLDLQAGIVEALQRQLASDSAQQLALLPEENAITKEVALDPR